MIIIFGGDLQKQYCANPQVMNQDVEELGSMQVQQLKTYMDPELNDDDEESGKTKQKASKVRALRE